jgi:hypothetical protein
VLPLDTMVELIEAGYRWSAGGEGAEGWGDTK